MKPPQLAGCHRSGSRSLACLPGLLKGAAAPQPRHRRGRGGRAWWGARGGTSPAQGTEVGGVLTPVSVMISADQGLRAPPLPNEGSFWGSILGGGVSPSLPRAWGFPSLARSLYARVSDPPLGRRVGRMAAERLLSRNSPGEGVSGKRFESGRLPGFS